MLWASQLDNFQFSFLCLECFLTKFFCNFQQNSQHVIHQIFRFYVCFVHNFLDFFLLQILYFTKILYVLSNVFSSRNLLVQCCPLAVFLFEIFLIHRKICIFVSVLFVNNYIVANIFCINLVLLYIQWTKNICTAFLQMNT